MSSNLVFYMKQLNLSSGCDVVLVNRGSQHGSQSDMHLHLHPDTLHKLFRDYINAPLKHLWPLAVE